MTMLRRLACLLTVLSPALGAQGTVMGEIRDEQGSRLAGVRVSIGTDRVTLSAITGSDGRFVLERIPAGQRRLEASKLGYLSASTVLTIATDSALIVGNTLIADGQRLPDVVVARDPVNRVTGMTIDARDRPVDDVIVEILGLGARDTTDAEGRFAFSGLAPGDYLIQWRKPGYGVAQSGITMVEGLDREFAVRMLVPDARDGLTVEVAASVADEATRRQRLRGGMSAIVGRDELARYGRARLHHALASSSGAVALFQTRAECVLINGHEPATMNTARAFREAGPRPRTVTSIDPGGTRRRRSTGGSTRTRPPEPPGQMSAFASGLTWLSYFRADEVEMVEVYPEGSENSRTLCGRFQPSSACSCPPEPAGIIVWLR